MLCNHITAVMEAALQAVHPARLVARRLSVVDGELLLDGVSLSAPLRLNDQGRVVVVGGGKAAAGMAAGLADVLSTAGFAADLVTGLVSVPEGCGRRVAGIEVRETRPAAANLPTQAAVAATEEMMSLVGSLSAGDVVFAVISGGGSALLEMPRRGMLLEDIIAVVTFLSAAGATITEINTVRQAASDVKGGGLARACAAGLMIVLVLSDVIGDPLDSIASGPCMPVAFDASKALDVLERYGAIEAGIAPRFVEVLRKDVSRSSRDACQGPSQSGGLWTTGRGCRVDHLLVGSNATAVDAAADAARHLGYDAIVHHASPRVNETADEVGQRFAREGLALAAAVAADGCPRAIVEGGEAVVRLPSDHGIGGRNQQTVLTAALACLAGGKPWPHGLAIASIGTDGEDGPTPAAGGIVDAAVATRIADRLAESRHAAARFDAFPLLEEVGGLVVTGPSGTNVADVRVVLASPTCR
jgi:hydroxypyruvate reductase